MYSHQLIEFPAGVIAGSYQVESHEARLYHDLLDKHNPEIRPVANFNETVVVTFGAALQMIAEMVRYGEEITRVFELYLLNLNGGTEYSL